MYKAPHHYKPQATVLLEQNIAMVLLLELPVLFLLSAIFAVSIVVLLFKTNNYDNDLPPSPFPLPIIGHFHLLTPPIHRSLHSLSLRHGPLLSFRLGSLQCVAVSTPDLAKQFLRTNELSFICHANTTAIRRLTYDSSLAFAPYGAYWKFVKKLTMNELLGGRPIADSVPVRTREYRRLLIRLAEKAELREAVNLTEELPKLSNGVITRMVLGGSSKAMSLEEGGGRAEEEARSVIREVTEIFGEFNLADFVWFFRKLDLQGFGKRIEDIYKRFDALLEKIIAEREELRKHNKGNNISGEKCNVGGEKEDEEEEVKDFLDVLLDITEDENAEVKLTRVHIKALVMVYII